MAISVLDTRFKTSAEIFEEFAAILKLKDLEEDQIHPACHSLVSKYTQDLTAGFENEVRHLKSVYNATFVDCQSPLDLLNSIYRMQLQSIFGEVCVAVRIFCSLPVCFWCRKGFQQVEACQRLSQVYPNSEEV